MTTSQTQSEQIRAMRDRQVLLLDRLFELSERQRALLAALGDATALLALLDERQLLIDELVRIDAACDAMRAPHDERVRLLAQRVLGRDNADAATLRERLAKTTTELADVREGGRAVGAYAQGGEALGNQGHSSQDFSA